MLRRTSVWSLYFNSQPHKEADGMWKRAEGAIYISTHSLTRRLTYMEKVGAIGIDISTHSLTRRLTCHTNHS